MKKNLTLKLATILLPLMAVSCKGPGSATTADSTTLYTGPISKLDSIGKKNSGKKDSINIGPDNFRPDSMTKAKK
ncbi:MAG: hypothetical protein JSU01_10430 [Bacteroidetes bacterium]|nr:hypothetical protein [Bacteroidota bacterium]